MRIAIITFHRAINYGGILQAYALQTILTKKGYQCDILDYRCPNIEEQYRSSFLLTKKNIKRIGYTILKNGTIKRNLNGFLLFTERYLKLSKDNYSPSTISNSNLIYDTFITGSDQVWSPTCAGFDKNYFLNFVNEKNNKISYAASFGVSEIPNNLKKDYKELLKNIDYISVREESGMRIIKQLINKKIKVTLDPTLLLRKTDWELFKNKINIKSKYVLLYMISEDKRIINYAKKYAKSKNLDVIYINDRIYKTIGVKNLKNINPDEWVSLFLNAECIFTNSFHGVAFSINFEKEFFAFRLKQNIKVNERITNILNLFNLNDRLISEYEEINNASIIDIQKNNLLLDNLRKKSFDFLEKSIQKK